MATQTYICGGAHIYIERESERERDLAKVNLHTHKVKFVVFCREKWEEYEPENNISEHHSTCTGLQAQVKERDQKRFQHTVTEIHNQITQVIVHKENWGD